MTEVGVSSGGSRWLTMRRHGVMVVLDVGGPDLPRMVHWGKDLGELSDEEIAALPLAGEKMRRPRRVDGGVPFTLSPTRAQGWPGWPGLTGHRHGLASQPLFVLQALSHSEIDGGDKVTFIGGDSAAQLRLEGELVLDAQGVLHHRFTLTSTAAGHEPAYEVEDLCCLLPLPEELVEVADFAGRWGNEAQLQRHDLSQGTWLREQRRGRTGPDTPLVVFAGTKGFDFGAGEVWGIHFGWSGDQRYLVQRLNSGFTLFGAGEILGGGEVILGSGESVTTPWTYAVYSAEGIDGATARFHSMLRARPGHPHKPRPVLLNTWEAVLFDHSFDRLAELAEVASSIGVERFVIDDGWFGSRRDDTKGLGDWYVSEDVWPGGLRRIVDRVAWLGMDFGLWFEPEMINPDSELARRHPEWIMGTPGRTSPTWRHQWVLDISHPDAYAYLLERIDSLVTEYGIAFIKWDHNRDLYDPVHRSGPRIGRPAVRDQTLAAYALMDELRRRHPGLEIESCSSGGSRIDLGVLQRTDRVWASDINDPIERVRIVSGISTLLPLELIGTHVASPRSMTTGRQHDLSLRLIVALFGHQGFEWDLTSTTEEERRYLATWVALAKSVRGLLHSGRLVRIERPADPGTTLFGVVARDRSEALFALVRSYTSPQSETPPLRLRGLEASARYRLERLRPTADAPELQGPTKPSGAEGITVPGSLLMGTGVEAPVLRPEDAALFHLTRVS